jgi:hypothetical protein
MNETKIFNNLRILDGINIKAEDLNKSIFYIDTTDILAKSPCFSDKKYINTLNPIINSIKINYDINGLYDNVVLQILNAVEQIKGPLCLDEADFFIILHKNKCVAKFKNLIKVTSGRSICIDIDELIVNINQIRYSRDLIKCIVSHV